MHWDCYNNYYHHEQTLYISAVLQGIGGSLRKEKEEKGCIFRTPGNSHVKIIKESSHFNPF